MSLLEFFPVAWFAVITISMIAYAILDGFDLGVGIIYLFFKKEENRRIVLNSIGPFWDGNEVWLIICFAGTFAGFPKAYTTFLSNFYIPIWVLVVGLIFRVTSIEFRSKFTPTLWRSFWDHCFSISSLLITFLLGSFIGVLLKGLPLSASIDLNCWRELFSLLPIAAGLFAVTAFALHGLIFLLLKTSGDLNTKVKVRISYVIGFYLVSYFIFAYLFLTKSPEVSVKMKHLFLFKTVLILPLLNLFCIRKVIQIKRYIIAFILSSLNFVLLFSVASIAKYPYIIFSTTDQVLSVTIENAAVGNKTLKVLLTIVGLGLPFVFVYIGYLFRVFKGETKLDDTSY